MLEQLGIDELDGSAKYTKSSKKTIQFPTVYPGMLGKYKLARMNVGNELPSFAPAVPGKMKSIN